MASITIKNFTFTDNLKQNQIETIDFPLKSFKVVISQREFKNGINLTNINYLLMSTVFEHSFNGKIIDLDSLDYKITRNIDLSQSNPKSKIVIVSDNDIYDDYKDANINHFNDLLTNLKAIDEQNIKLFLTNLTIMNEIYRKCDLNHHFIYTKDTHSYKGIINLLLQYNKNITL